MTRMNCDVVEDLSEINKVCKIYMARNKPLLLKGAACEWDAAGKWTLDFFRQDRFSAINVNISLDGKEAGPKRQMSVQEYVKSFTEGAKEPEQSTGAEGSTPGGGKTGEESTHSAGTAATDSQPRNGTETVTASGESLGSSHNQGEGGSDEGDGGGTGRAFVPYMRAWYFSDDCPELGNDFPDPPPYFPDKFKGVGKEFQPPFTWIFIGPRGAFSPLHRDIWFTCAWMAQFSGRKRFVFYAPKDLKHVYRKVEGKELYADPLRPNLEIFPTFHEATPIEAVLEPGDVLYIPSKWPHFVECVTDSVSLTCNFANVANFKHVLVPYTRWLERRRLAMEMMKKMMAASLGGGKQEEEGGGEADAEEREGAHGEHDLRAEEGDANEEGRLDEDEDEDD